VAAVASAVGLAVVAVTLVVAAVSAASAASLHRDLATLIVVVNNVFHSFPPLVRLSRACRRRESKSRFRRCPPASSSTQSGRNQPKKEKDKRYDLRNKS